MGRLSTYLRFFGRKSSVIGHVDVISKQRVSGWVWDKAQPDRALTVSITLAGEVIGQTEASLPRPDLAVAGIGDGRHGFDFTFGPPHPPDAHHKITVMVGALKLPIRPHAVRTLLTAVPLADDNS